MGAIISCEASVINDRWKGPQSHKIGGFHDDEDCVYGYYAVWSGGPNFLGNRVYCFRQWNKMQS